MPQARSTKKDADLGRLERVAIRDVWETEAAHFTPWLARPENIRLMGETLALDLELEVEEEQVGPLRADILCKNTIDGNWVLIENQLERTDHAQLGELLTYAAGLHAVTIVWVAHEFTDQHRAALDWLNDITGADFNFFGLEVELWRIGSSAVAPKFNVVCKPNSWIKSVATGTRGIEEAELTPVKKLQLEYWQELRAYIESRASEVRCQKPPARHYCIFAIGRVGFYLSSYISIADKRIGIELVIHGPDAKAHFHLLRAQRRAIEAPAEMDCELIWREMPRNKVSYVEMRCEQCDPARREDWPEQHAWFLEKLKLFRRVFGERVRKLDAGEWEAGEIEG